jgi:hypothetical protein
MTTVDITPRSGADTFVRYGMVACAIIYPLAIAVSLLLSPFDPTVEGEAYVRSFAANIDGYSGLGYWLGGVSLFATIPALLAVGKVARWGRRTLGLVGMIFAFVLAIPVTGNSDDVIYAALKSGADVTTTSKILDTFNNNLPSAALGWTFLLGLVGVVLLGVSALIGRSAPAWAAISLIIAPVLIPVAWFGGLGIVFAVIPWLLMTAGMGGVALTLLKEPAAG